MAALTLIAAVAAFVVTLDRLRLARTARTLGGASEPWWFGYARGGLHLAGAIALGLAHGVAGLQGPHALAAGVAVALGVYATHEVCVDLRARRPALAALCAGLLMALPAAAAPEALDRAIGAALAALFA